MPCRDTPQVHPCRLASAIHGLRRSRPDIPAHSGYYSSSQQNKLSPFCNNDSSSGCGGRGPKTVCSHGWLQRAYMDVFTACLGTSAPATGAAQCFPVFPHLQKPKKRERAPPFPLMSYMQPANRRATSARAMGWAQARAAFACSTTALKAGLSRTARSANTRRSRVMSAFFRPLIKRL